MIRWVCTVLSRSCATLVVYVDMCTVTTAYMYKYMISTHDIIVMQPLPPSPNLLGYMFATVVHAPNLPVPSPYTCDDYQNVHVAVWTGMPSMYYVVTCFVNEIRME